jgi:hypothetical protein
MRSDDLVDSVRAECVEAILMPNGSSTRTGSPAGQVHGERSRTRNKRDAYSFYTADRLSTRPASLEMTRCWVQGSQAGVLLAPVVRLFQTQRLLTGVSGLSVV